MTSLLALSLGTHCEALRVRDTTVQTEELTTPKLIFMHTHARPSALACTVNSLAVLMIVSIHTSVYTRAYRQWAAIPLHCEFLGNIGIGEMLATLLIPPDLRDNPKECQPQTTVVCARAHYLLTQDPPLKTVRAVGECSYQEMPRPNGSNWGTRIELFGALMDIAGAALGSTNCNCNAHPTLQRQITKYAALYIPAHCYMSV